MAGKSNYLEDKILNWLKGTSMGTSPAGLYVRLFTADPTDAGSTANECTTTIRAGGGVAATFGSITTASGANTMANTGTVDFGTAAGAVTGVSHFGIFDAATGGNMLYSDALTTPRNVALGAAVSFAAGALVVSEN